jgi:capsular polysaccharide transport system permease protein
MRFGHENLGFFWVILEPLMFAGGVALIWTFIRVTHGQVSTVTFALTGYIMITLFRHVVGASNRILRRNLTLRFHANVKPLDIYTARALLETLGCLAAFYVAYVPLSVFGIIDPMRDPLLAMGAYALQAWFCFGFGLILAAVSEMSEVLERVLPVTMYLTLPLTGAFTMQAWLPPTARKILAWSPMVNTVEMFRSGMFSADVPTEYDVWYVVWWCFAQTAVALVLFDYVRRRVDMA